jgi:hypothetical protein
MSSENDLGGPGGLKPACIRMLTVPPKGKMISR